VLRSQAAPLLASAAMRAAASSAASRAASSSAATRAAASSAAMPCGLFLRRNARASSSSSRAPLPTRAALPLRPGGPPLPPRKARRFLSSQPGGLFLRRQPRRFRFGQLGPPRLRRKARRFIFGQPGASSSAARRRFLFACRAPLPPPQGAPPSGQPQWHHRPPYPAARRASWPDAGQWRARARRSLPVRSRAVSASAVQAFEASAAAASRASSAASAASHARRWTRVALVAGLSNSSSAAPVQRRTVSAVDCADPCPPARKRQAVKKIMTRPAE
jgi:hypothetical protein